MKTAILIGATGKMGTMLQKNLPESYRLIGCIDQDNADYIDQSADVIIDFSTPQSTMKYAPFYLSKGIPFVSGTTGLTMSEMNSLEQLTAYYHGHLRLCSSFDLHFRDLLTYISESKKLFHSAIVEEWHFIDKKDAPSGTAKAILATLSPLKTSVVSHRTKSAVLRHQITMRAPGRRIILSYEVLDKTVYLPGILQALELTSLKGFFKGL